MERKSAASRAQRKVREKVVDTEKELNKDEITSNAQMAHQKFITHIHLENLKKPQDWQTNISIARISPDEGGFYRIVHFQSRSIWPQPRMWRRNQIPKSHADPNSCNFKGSFSPFIDSPT